MVELDFETKKEDVLFEISSCKDTQELKEKLEELNGYDY